MLCDLYGAYPDNPNNSDIIGELYGYAGSLSGHTES